MSSSPQFNIELPPSFRCPYRKPCWTREAVRVVIATTLTLIVLHLTGCGLDLIGPGVSFHTRAWWPTEPPASQPAERVVP